MDVNLDVQLSSGQTVIKLRSLLDEITNFRKERCKLSFYHL